MINSMFRSFSVWLVVFCLSFQVTLAGILPADAIPPKAQALQAVARMIEKRQFKEARQALDRFMPQPEQKLYLHLLYSELAYQQDDFERAESELTNAYELGGNQLVTNIAAGRFYLLRNDPEKSISYFEKATKLSPKAPVVWIGLAEAKFSQDQGEEQLTQVLDAFRRAEDLEPVPYPSESRLAQLYAGLHEFEAALFWYEMALKRRPNHAETMLHMARTELRLGRLVEARTRASELVRQVPARETLLLHAQICDIMGELPQAEKAYRAILSEFPRDPIVNNNLAMIIIRAKGKPEEAMLHAKAAHKAVPDHASIRATYGCVLQYAGKTDEALPFLDEAIKEKTKDPWVFYMHGLAMQSLSKKEEVILDWKKVLEYGANFPHKEEIEIWLAENIELPIAFDEVCLVTLAESNKAEKGVLEFKADFKGKRVLFASAERKNQFLADPNKYWPGLDGNCPVGTFEDKKELPGIPTIMANYLGKVWFFSSEEKRTAFLENATKYLDQSAEGVIFPSCLVTLKKKNMHILGSIEHQVEYNGYKLRFAGTEELAEFEKSPETYWPAHDGNCIVTKTLDRKTVKGNPLITVVYKNKLWFFADNDKLKTFVANPSKYLEKEAN